MAMEGLGSPRSGIADRVEFPTGLCMADIYYNVVHSKLSNFVIPYMSDISYDIMTLKYPIFYAELVNCHISELPFLYMVATLGHSSSFSELPLFGWNYVGYSSNLKEFCPPPGYKILCVTCCRLLGPFPKSTTVILGYFCWCAVNFYYCISIWSTIPYLNVPLIKILK